jgi:hypothetical protein
MAVPSLTTFADKAFISDGNASVTPLASTVIFTGDSEDVSQFSSITVNIFTDQDSATKGIKLQFSTDATNWTSSEIDEYDASVDTEGKTYLLTVEARYFRVVFANGATAQTEFRLQSIYNVRKSGKLNVGVVDIEDTDILAKLEINNSTLKSIKCTNENILVELKKLNTIMSEIGDIDE